MIKKIISGGQKGADVSSLDFAIYHGIAHGGFCPKRRRCENGIIDVRYQLQETSSSSYLQRTEKNVQHADGTAVFTMRQTLTGGSKRTTEFALKHAKPWLHIHSAMYDAPAQLLRFIKENKVEVLNVAGSRSSKEPGIYEFVKGVLEKAFFPRPDSWLGGSGEG
jgi:Circularly permutated YpsA SLOG family